jgi:glutathione S-transferase
MLNAMKSASRALSWSQLQPLASAFTPPPQTHGPAHAQALLRTFGRDESEVRVTLFRDNHAWCPYCQKVWLWLEEKRVPYRIAKVTMFCYGEKEAWYKRIVPSGMLPALELDGRLITESDVILGELEAAFGPLGEPMAKITPQRRLERQLFGAWCEWLCYPSASAQEEALGQRTFEEVLTRFERELGAMPGPWVRGGDAPSTADIVFVPYVERMAASLYYYKGFTMRDSHVRPRLCAWFDALEAREAYRGTQSDFHTHVHDLPPQMGGCYSNGEPQQRANAERVDCGPWVGLPDTGVPEPPTSKAEAAARVIRHREAIVSANPCATPEVVDEALRCALTRLLTGEAITPPERSDAALRYIRDRVNVVRPVRTCPDRPSPAVGSLSRPGRPATHERRHSSPPRLQPRDMSVWAGRRLREALEETAALAGTQEGPPIPVKHRRDQNPLAFRRQASAG